MGRRTSLWEQAALDQIVSGRPFTDDDIDLLIQYILEDKKLCERHSERPQLTYLTAEIGKAASPNRKIRLVSISDLSNVNALAANQKLTFDEQLTVVYGDNGSGKSGYARLLGCAGFTRGDHDVYPNVLNPATAAGPQTAKFEISVDGEIREVDYTIGDACPGRTAGPSPPVPTDGIQLAIQQISQKLRIAAVLGSGPVFSLVISLKAIKEGGASHPMRVKFAPNLPPPVFGRLFFANSQQLGVGNSPLFKELPNRCIFRVSVIVVLIAFVRIRT